MPKMFPFQQSMSEGNRRGNTVGEQGHARGVPPPRPPGPTRVAVRWQCVSSCVAPRQLQSALWVAEPGHRAAVCAARQVRRSWRNGQSQYRGVSDHAIWPLRLPSPRPRTWSLTPRCLCLSRSRSSSDACVRAMSKARGSASSTPAVARRLCGSQLARSRRSAPQRFAPPALRAADGLDRASRDPFSATIDGQHGSA